MEITFDPKKDLLNQQKHGVSLRAATDFEWDGSLIMRDDRKDYGEMRFIALGYIGNRIYCVVFTDKENGERRIISLRKANSREVKRYV